jgi:EAL domain-containing protein (putative c-di-GMP-specific phosphodiesterase class I)/ActR/RegA family two-component response regulator
MQNENPFPILLLDDDVFTLKLIHRMLEKEGWTNVVACAAGHAALAEMDTSDSPPALIMFDLNMPAMDGIEFIRELAKRNFVGNLIMISGVDARLLQTAEKLVQAYGLRLLGCLTKPVLPAELAALMLDTSIDEVPVLAGRMATVYTAEALRHALERDELINYYQPKVDIRSATVVGFEALVRWHHPTDGVVPPDDFIGLAETSGLMAQLTQHVLRQALADLRRWRADGLDLTVAVNISMGDMTDLAFPDLVARELDAFAQSAHHLVLELTESRLARDWRAALDIVVRLRMKGVSISIDDFGTGHSSLTQLNALPFTQLKIDKSFVHRAWRDPSTRAMYDASLGMTKQLRIDAVAEGVEDFADWDFLRRTDCPTAQGYFIGRPMPVEAIAAWLSAWTARALLLRDLGGT